MFWFLSFCHDVDVTVCMPRVCLSCPPICWCAHPPINSLPRTRGPGGERGERGVTGGHGHPRDQRDGRERRAHAQRRLHAGAPWRALPGRVRRAGRRARDRRGPPVSWPQHARSGGQEAEVRKADGGEWGFWVSLHREEPVLRACPSFPLPHSWGNLGNHVWGRGSDFPFTSCAELHRPKRTALSSVCPVSFIHLLTLSLFLVAGFLSNPFLDSLTT